MSTLTFIGRGGVAGAAAGALSGLFSMVLAGPVIDRAVAAEGHTEAVFSRDVQYVGLLVAAVLSGVAIGILFGAVYAWLHRGDPAADPWARSLRLAGAGFLGVTLLPFMRYPASPPGVGDPATVEARTAAWLGAIAIGLASVAAAREVVRRPWSVPARHLGAVGAVLIGLGLIFLLPAPGASGAVSADLLWTFRLLSLVATGVLWAGLGVGFGLAGLRGARAATAVPAA